MKNAAKGLLGAVGLAPAAQVERLLAESRHAGTKMTQLEERLAAARDEAEKWKRRYEEATSGVAEWKQAASTAQEKVERAKADAERAEARTEEWRARAEAFKEQLQQLRGRLEDAQRAATIAREHLMAIEVKLDLLEAGIQVLDNRTRETVVARS